MRIGHKAGYDQLMVRLIVFIVVAAFSALRVMAAPDDAALSLYREGDYVAAADRAEEIGGAENLALAARALNAAAYLDEDDKRAKRTAKRAAKLADEAVERNPDLVEAYLQGAIAMAQRGSRMSAFRAFLAGLGPGARERLDKALALEPENPWALSTSAGWHLGVAARAGDGRFGADAATGFAQFQAARALDPENLSICYEMALRVLAFGEPAWRADALEALEGARAAPVSNVFDAALKARADKFAAAIATGPEAEADFIAAQP